MSLIPRGSFFDFDRFFDDFSGLPQRQESSGNAFFTPRVDIVEHDNQYEITAEMPGVKKEDLNVTLEDGVLTIEAECKQEEKEEKEGKLIRQERRYGKFLRSFSLGNNVQQQDIQASFDDGVLRLTAPKMAEASPQQRRIEIN